MLRWLVLAAVASVVGGFAPIGTFPRSEGSGVVASRQYPGVYWAQRDSGLMATRTELYAFKLDHGRLVDLTPGVKFREFAVQGATNDDWEDIALDDHGRLYIGNFGNNLHTRKNLAILAMKEPDPYKATTVKVEAAYPFTYPDRPPKGRSFDCESLILVDGLPYLLTKTRTPTLYRMPALKKGQSTVLERVADLALPPDGLAGRPTGMDLSSDGARLAVTTGGNVLYVYERTQAGAQGLALMKDLVAHPPRWQTPYTPSGTREAVEGVAFTGGTHDLVLLSERGPLLSFPAWFYEKP